MNAKEPLRAVLFDLGDTLVDLGEGRGSYEERLQARVGRVYDVLAADGVRLPPRAAFCDDLAADSEAQYHAALAEQQGISIFAVMHRFLARRGLPHDEHTVDRAGEAYCTGGALVPSDLRTGALATLTALRGWGVQLGVISNTVQPARFMAPLMVRRGLAHLIDVQLYSSDCGVAKPHPRIFEDALAALAVAPAHAAYVGDRLVADVGGAQAVGMQGVLIEVGHRDEQHPEITPDARICELPELLDVLPQLFEVTPGRDAAATDKRKQR